MAIGKKEQGLINGSYMYLGAFFVVAIILGQYVHFATKDRSQASANRK